MGGAGPRWPEIWGGGGQGVEDGTSGLAGAGWLAAECGCADRWRPRPLGLRETLGLEASWRAEGGGGVGRLASEGV